MTLQEVHRRLEALEALCEAVSMLPCVHSFADSEVAEGSDDVLCADECAACCARVEALRLLRPTAGGDGGE